MCIGVSWPVGVGAGTGPNFTKEGEVSEVLPQPMPLSDQLLLAPLSLVYSRSRSLGHTYLHRAVSEPSTRVGDSNQAWLVLLFPPGHCTPLSSELGENKTFKARLGPRWAILLANVLEQILVAPSSLGSSMMVHVAQGHLAYKKHPPP